jgi:N-acetylmuramoyl-L-alanine amidase
LIFTPSPNADARPAGAVIDHLVLHYTGMRSAAAALARLCDPVAKVSSHYVVDEDGAVYALVGEEQRAWHAGVSFWRGVRQLNDRSIGVEIVNPGHEFGYRAYPKVQMIAVRDLCVGILARHPIPARNVVGHSDIAPDRKQDPGEMFDWRWLAAAGVGVWTDEPAPVGDIFEDLEAIGYDPSLPARDVIRAFQRRFLPDQLTGEADELTQGRVVAILGLFVSQDKTI